MAEFGLNDEVLAQFGLDDEVVGQAAVTQKPTPYKLRNAPARPVAMPGIVQQVPNYTPEQLQAAEAGVDVDTGVDRTTGIGLGFSGNNDERAAYLTARLSKRFGQPVQVRVGPESGQMEYLSPKTQRWTVAEASNFGTGAIDALGGLGGGLAGFALGASTANPLAAAGGAIAGSAAGAGAATAAKLKVGQAIGAVDKDYPIGSDVLGSAIEAAAWDTGTMASLGLSKYARYWFKGSRTFAAKEAAALGKAAADADRIVAEIERGSGREFNPTIGQRTINANLDKEGSKAREKALRMQGALAGTDAGLDLSTLERANEDALVGYFDGMNEPFLLQTVDGLKQLSAEEASKNVTAGLLSGYDSMLDSARKLAASLPPDFPAAERGKIMRAALAQADKDFKTNVEDPAWAAYRDGTGYDPATFSSKIRVPWSKEARKLMEKWDARSRESIISALGRENNNIKLIFKETEPSKIVNKDGKPIRPAEPIEDVDLAVLDDTIKWLRADARDALKNQAGVTYNERDLVDLQNTLVQMRDDHLRTANPELHGRLQQAEAATKMRSDKFRTSAINELLIKEGPGRYRLNDAKVVKRILNANDTTAARQFNELTKGYPEAAQAARHMLYAYYRRDVIDPKTRAPSPSKHATFMKRYGEVIKEFFPNGDAADLRRLGGMGTAIAKHEQELKKVVPQFTKVFGEVASFNSEGLARQTMAANMTPEKIRLGARILKNNGQESLLEEWRHAVLTDLGNRMIKDGQINATELAKLVNGPQGRVVEELLTSAGNGVTSGKEYMAGLKTLDEALTMIRTKSAGQLEPQSQALISRLGRLILGPLSSEGRVITFGQQQRTKVVPGEIYKAITDPNELRKLAKESRKTMDQIRKAHVLGQIGNVLVNDDWNY